MQKLSFYTHCIVLATTPTLLAYPQNNLPHVQLQMANYGYQQETKEWIPPKTYDEIMQMLEDLESGKLERRCSPAQLERVNDYLATLAKEGLLPGEFEEEAALEEDLYNLMYGEDNAFQLAHYLENSSEYVIIPAVFNGHSDYYIIQCGKINNAWKKTKKFVKKHKKAIIIGAVVVVAVTVVVVAVAVAGTTAAGAAGAVAFSAASESGSPNLNNSESKEEAASVVSTKTPSPTTDVNESPIMKATIDEHISSFKEVLIEDKASQEVSSSGWDDLSFGEKAREIGANVAHKAFDEIADLAKVVPQLCEEVKEIGSKLLPESLTLSNAGSPTSPTENYQSLIAKGHQTIDKAFSTDQSDLFTPEAKANEPMKDFAIGMLPLPGGIPKLFSDTNNLIKAGNTIDRAGFTRSGRGLMKHGYREGSLFPHPLGNPAQINQQGEAILKEILNDPKRTIFKNNRGGIEIYSQSGRGAYFREDGTFRGFIEYGHK